jgi:hypothetical protein
LKLTKTRLLETSFPPLLLEVKNFGPNDSKRELARAFTYLLVPEQKRQITAALAAPIEATSLPTALLFTFFFFFVPQSSSSHPWGSDASRSKKTPLKGQAIERSKSMTKKWPMSESDGYPHIVMTSSNDKP